MYRLGRLSLAALIWTTCVATVLGQIPFFVCVCPTRMPPSPSLAAEQTKTCPCCGRPDCCCAVHEAEEDSSCPDKGLTIDDPSSLPADAHMDVTPCRRTLTQPIQEPAVAKEPRLVEPVLVNLVVPLFWIEPTLSAPTPFVAIDQLDTSPPRQDRVIVLRHLVI